MNKHFEENRKYIGSVIKTNRKKKNIPQEELADLLEVNKSTISRYENGLVDLPASNLEVISDKCNFNPIEYFHNKRNPLEVIEKIAENMKIDFNIELLKNNLPDNDISTYENVVISDDTMLNLESIEELSSKVDSSILMPVLDYVVNDILIEVEQNNCDNTCGRLISYCKAILKDHID